MPQIFLLGIIGVVFLTYGAERFIHSSVLLARRLRISPLIIGLTVVSLGTSAPELVVSLSAALKGKSAVALGNVIGSNISNLALIGGCSALVSPLFIEERVIRRDLPILLFSTLLFIFFMADGEFSRSEGILLLSGFVFVLLNWVISEKRRKEKLKIFAEETSPLEPESNFHLVKVISILLFGLALLVLGGQWTVESAVEIARVFEIPERVIAVSIVAVGTSLPELAASVAAALKRQSGLVIGNLIGSNFSNIFLILGLTGSLAPGSTVDNIAAFDIVSLGLVTLTFSAWLWMRKQFTVVGGVVFIGLYIFYVWSSYRLFDFGVPWPWF